MGETFTRLAQIILGFSFPSTASESPLEPQGLLLQESTMTVVQG